MNTDESCKIPTPKETTDTAKNALNSIGASTKCISSFKTHTRNKELTMSGGGLSLLGAAVVSGTGTDNTLDEDMKRDGCSSIYANLSQHVSSTLNMLCELNKTSSQTTVNGSASASVILTQKKLSKNQKELNEAILKSLVPPDNVKWQKGMPTAVFNALIESRDRQIESNEAIKKLLIPSISISNTQIKLKADVNFKVISQISRDQTTKLVEQAKNAAKSQALADIVQKTGFGANSPSVKSLIDQRLEDRKQSITDAINSSVNSVNISASSSTEIKFEVSGNISLDNVTIDENAQLRLITNNIMSIATNMGKDVANEIISDSASSTSSSSTSTGQEDVLKNIYDGFEKTVKANADAATGILSGIGNIFSFGIMGMLLIGLVVIMFVPNLLPGKSQGIIGILISVLLIYLISAWFMSWWPFHKDKFTKPQVQSNIHFTKQPSVVKAYSKNKTESILNQL